MRTLIFLLLMLAAPAALALAEQRDVNVQDYMSLRKALQDAQPGTRIRIAAGTHRRRVNVSNLKGTEERQIVIEGADPDRLPVFEGGSEGWHLSVCEYVTLRNIVVRGQRSSGINVDDDGHDGTPTHHIVLESISVSKIGTTGNHDGIKLSGVDDFVVHRCVVAGWGGQAIDMVGCHRGLIERCRFTGKEPTFPR